MGLEGVVSKRSDAPYVSRRSGLWIKAKCPLRQELWLWAMFPPQPPSQSALWIT
jgi:bifunctional non-homologous end joining protein LigD